MRSIHRFAAALLPLLLSAAGACAGGAKDSAPGDSSDGGFAPSGSGGVSAGAGGRGGRAPDPLPPEREVESSYEVPVATGRFVWIANPSSGQVAFVDAQTLAVRTVEAGNGPTYLAPVPGASDAVVVLNVLSHDASYLRADAGGRLDSVLIPGVAPRANAWAVSPDGRWAVAWTDARRALAGAAASPVITAGRLDGFQDITAIDLTTVPPTATTVAVGFRPVSLDFDATSRRAFAVTEDGVTVVGLPGPSGTVEVLRDVPLGADATAGADTRDVSLTPDGQAVVRQEGSADVRIVDLATGAAGVVTLGGPVTDVDVSADGAQAVAVVRATGEVAIMPLATAAANPASVRHVVIEGEIVGSVVLTADARQAVLFSNASGAERVTVLDLAGGGYRVLRVHAPVLSAHPTPDGRHLLVVHRVPAAGGSGSGSGSGSASGAAGGGNGGAGGSAGASGSKSNGAGGAPAPSIADAVPASGPGAFTVIPLDGSRSGRIQETGAPPQSVAFSPASDRALVPIRDDGARTFGVYIVTMPSLQVSLLALASPPISAGVVAGANRGFVAQRHPEGRITFVPFAGGAPRTLTGFELGARVVQGETP